MRLTGAPDPVRLAPAPPAGAASMLAAADGSWPDNGSRVGRLQPFSSPTRWRVQPMLEFLGAGVSVAYHLVTVLVHVLTPVAGPVAVPAAIVAFTVIVRLLLLPLSYSAQRGQAAQARLQPQLAELRRQHAGQPERLQREVAALYQRAGSSLLTGCLPLLAQLPVFSIMYRLFLSPSVGGRPDLLLARSLLGARLGAHWLGAAGPFSGPGLVFLGLFALLGLVGWMSVRVTRRAPAAGALLPVVGAGPSTAQDKIMAVLGRAIPYSTVVVAMFVPLATGLYLLTTTAWTVAERAVLRRRLVPPSAAGATSAGTAAA